ncbi:hypothetical protein GGR51DRAFT_559238 [Nemania sp. FL0031]|nr:hypothetical protein GGR51DRAFT_559238 [Nemania sp. FL0031]
MESSFRVELLEDEKKRRDEVIAAAEKHRKGAADAITKRFENGVIPSFCAEILLNDKDIGKYPLVSAAYQHWLEDYHAWFSIFKTKDGFNWPKPDKFGAPYSRIFVEKFYKETKDEKDKRTEEQKRYTKAFPNTAEAGPSQAEADDSDNDANWENSVMVPNAWRKDGILTPVEHSSFQDGYNVWTKLFGNNLWPKNCEPFEIPIPKHMDPQVILAAPEDLPELMFKLWKEFSPGEPWCVRIFIRYCQDPSARFGIRMWLLIDWPATQDLENISWLRHVYYATLRLYSWYDKLLRGEQVHILKEIVSQNEWEFGQHHSVFKNIRIREAVNAQRSQAKDDTEGDKAVTRALHRKQQVTILALAFRGVEERMEATPDPDQKLRLLLEAVLANAVHAALGADNETIETRMSEVSEYLTQQANSVWGKLLPGGIRFEVTREVLQQYKFDVEDQAFIAQWFEARSFIKNDNEYPGWDIGPLAKALRGL